MATQHQPARTHTAQEDTRRSSKTIGKLKREVHRKQSTNYLLGIWPQRQAQPSIAAALCTVHCNDFNQLPLLHRPSLLCAYVISFMYMLCHALLPECQVLIRLPLLCTIHQRKLPMDGQYMPSTTQHCICSQSTSIRFTQRSVQ